MKLINTFCHRTSFWACRPVAPQPLHGPRLLHLNRALLGELGLGEVSEAQWLACCGQGSPAGHAAGGPGLCGPPVRWLQPAPRGWPRPAAGEQLAPDGNRWDLHLKGAGKTPFSRFGDGRAVLRSSIREYLASEALHALGIPTTRALVLLGSDEPVYREQVESGRPCCAPRRAICASVISSISHGAGRGEDPALIDYARRYHFPELADGAELFAEVVRRTARLIARSGGGGFCHGVMNTDNMSPARADPGLRPLRFYRRLCAGLRLQPLGSGRSLCAGSAACGRILEPAEAGQALAGHVDGDALASALAQYEHQLMLVITRADARQAGAGGVWEEEDPALFRELFRLLAAHKVDYHLFLRRLGEVTREERGPPACWPCCRILPSGRWLEAYRARLAREGSYGVRRQMDAVNPKYVQAQRPGPAGDRGGRTGRHGAVRAAVCGPCSTL